MTPVTLVALADRNTHDYLGRLIDSLHNCSRLHAAHLQLQVHILSDLYDITDDSFEARQVQHALEQRQQQQAQCFAQLEQASQDVAASLQTLRQHQAQLDQDLQQVLGERSQSPAMRQCQHELQTAREARESLARDQNALRQECTQKLAVYVSHPLYRYLRQQGFASATYRRNALNRLLDAWLARQCNFTQNLRNEQLLNAMLEHSNAELAGHDTHIKALEQRLEQMRQALTQQPAQTQQLQHIKALAEHVIAARNQLEPHYRDAYGYAQCKDGDGQDALRWLKYELKTDSLERALDQWAAIGAPQPERYHRELRALREQLNTANLQVDQSIQALEQAQTLEVALRKSLAPFDCNCHAAPNTPSQCVCQLLLPIGDRYAQDRNYPSLIDSYMKRTLLLNTLTSTIKAARLAPSADPEHTLDNTFSPAPQLMQGHP